MTKPDDMYIISAARSGLSLRAYKHICSKFSVRFLNYPDVKTEELPLEAAAPHSSSLLGSAGSILSFRQSRGKTGIKYVFLFAQQMLTTDLLLLYLQYSCKNEC